MVAAGAGCSRLRPTFSCDDAADCVLSGAQGTCEPVGFYSFPRSGCPSGRAFGEGSSEPLAGTCVPVGDDAAPGPSDAGDVIEVTADAAAGDVRRVGSSITGEVTATEIRVRAPTETAVDDLVWMVLYTDLSATTVEPPSGWQLYGEKRNTADNFRSWFCYRVATTAARPRRGTSRRASTRWSTSAGWRSSIGRSTPRGRPAR